MLEIKDTLGQICFVLCIIERFSLFQRSKNVLLLVIEKCPLLRGPLWEGMYMYMLSLCCMCAYIHMYNFYRYGLPVNFLSIVVKPHRKSGKKVHELLKDQYGYLDSKFVASDIEVSCHCCLLFIVCSYNS